MVQVAQARVILTALQALADAHGGASCILTGDFNSTPKSAVYRFIENGCLDCAAEDRRQMSGQLCPTEEGWPPSWLKKVAPALSAPSPFLSLFVFVYVAGHARVRTCARVCPPPPFRCFKPSERIFVAVQCNIYSIAPHSTPLHRIPNHITAEHSTAGHGMASHITVPHRMA